MPNRSQQEESMLWWKIEHQPITRYPAQLGQSLFPIYDMKKHAKCHGAIERSIRELQLMSIGYKSLESWIVDFLLQNLQHLRRSIAGSDLSSGIDQRNRKTARSCA